MAYTAGTGFRFRRTISGVSTPPAPVKIRIANSTTLRIGDLVRVNTSGLLVGAGAGNPVAGVLVGLVDENGKNVLGQGVTNNTGSTLTGDDQVTTSSSNATRANYVQGEVVLDVAGDILWYNDSDTDLAQTNLFQFCDVDANNRQAATSSTSDANGQLQLIALDPDEDGDASKGLFRISENQFGIGIDTATAKNAA